MNPLLGVRLRAIQVKVNVTVTENIKKKQFRWITAIWMNFAEISQQAINT